MPERAFEDSFIRGAARENQPRLQRMVGGLSLSLRKTNTNECYGYITSVVYLLEVFQSLGSVVYAVRVPFVSAKVKVLENVSFRALP